jgi:hypothetical protein
MTDIEKTLEAARRAEARSADRILREVLPKINGLVATMARMGDQESAAKVKNASATLGLIAKDVATRASVSSFSRSH